MLSFLFINTTLRRNNLKSRTAMKIAVFLICVEVMIYLLLYNMNDCTFNISRMLFASDTILCLKEVFVRSFFKSQYPLAKVINNWFLL